MKRVVIIRSNPVKPDSRVEKEALALHKAGYVVSVLAWDRDSTHNLSIEELMVGDSIIPIIRLGFKASFGEGFKNIKAYLKFQLAIRSWIRENREKIDIIHACDFDTAFFTYRLAKRINKTFVFDIFDFLGGGEKNLFQKIIKKAQFDIINHADATIICTEERKKQIDGSTPQRLVVIHNTPSEEQLPKEFTNLNLNSQKTKVCYIGILQNGRLLKEIGHYFENHSNVELHIGGFGYLDSYFSELSERCDNIFYYGRIQYKNTLNLEHNCDIMLAIYDPTVENHRFAAPNKFYESLFLGKPVIMVKNTGMSQVVKENDIGVLIDYSEYGFEEGINQLLSKNEEWPMIEQRMKNIYKEKYSWLEMEGRLIELYNTISN